jgi:peptidoglycan/xylan/chitin deacetylase (PgdA/CDA1 family)
MLIDRAHRVGNHTFNHLQGMGFSTSHYLSNVEKASRYIDSALFRPPHGHLRPGQVLALRKNYTIIMWDVVTRDYSPRMTPEKVFNTVKKYTRNGSIIIFHDSFKAERNLKEALPQSIEWILSKGYKFRVIES